MSTLKNANRKSARTRISIMMLMAVGAFGLFSLPYLLLAGEEPAGKPADYPAWWFGKDVITPKEGTVNAPPQWPADFDEQEDYSAVNQGQLKWMAKGAFLHLQDKFSAPGVSAAITASAEWTALANLIQGWDAAVDAKDYAAANQGQLKEVARHFYDVFALPEVNYHTDAVSGWTQGDPYPWTGEADAKDFAVANQGQVKNLFAFDLSEFELFEDTDGDGIADDWERNYFADDPDDPDILTYLGGDDGQGVPNDYDGDGISDLAEFQAEPQTDPTDWYNGEVPVITLDAGSQDQVGGPDALLANPILLTLTKQDGSLYTDAPVKFEVTAGNALLMDPGAGGEPPALEDSQYTERVVQTDAVAATASMYLYLPVDTAAQHTVRITAGSASVEVNAYANGLLAEFYQGTHFGDDQDPLQAPVVVNSLGLQFIESDLRAVDQLDAAEFFPPTSENHHRYSFRLRGDLIAEETGTHQFWVPADDGVRIWLDGELVVDDWWHQGAQSPGYGSKDLVAGQSYRIVIESFDYLHGSQLDVTWRKPGASLPETDILAYEAVPKEALRPAADTIPLTTPGNLRIEATTSDALLVKWDAVPGNVGEIQYQVFFPDGVTQLQTTEVTSALIPVPEFVTSGTVSVVAVNRSGETSAPVTLNWDEATDPLGSLPQEVVSLDHPENPPVDRFASFGGSQQGAPQGNGLNENNLVLTIASNAHGLYETRPLGAGEDSGGHDTIVEWEKEDRLDMVNFTISGSGSITARIEILNAFDTDMTQLQGSPTAGLAIRGDHADPAAPMVVAGLRPVNFVALQRIAPASPLFEKQVEIRKSGDVGTPPDQVVNYNGQGWIRLTRHHEPYARRGNGEGRSTITMEYSYDNVTWQRFPSMPGNDTGEQGTVVLERVPLDMNVGPVLSAGQGESTCVAKFSDFTFESIFGDTDGDGLPDAFEQRIIDAGIADQNGDGYVDYFDVLPEDNFDGDNMTNRNEYLIGADPTVPDPDADNDGLPDWFEVGELLTETFNRSFTIEVSAGNVDWDSWFIFGNKLMAWNLPDNKSARVTGYKTVDGQEVEYAIHPNLNKRMEMTELDEFPYDAERVIISREEVSPLHEVTYNNQGAIFHLDREQGEDSEVANYLVWYNDTQNYQNIYNYAFRINYTLKYPEYYSATDPQNPDMDGDGLSDGQEYFDHRTDPFKIDTDDDGMPDNWEVAYNLKPIEHDQDDNVVDSNDSLEDPDGDGLANVYEYWFHSNPQKADSEEGLVVEVLVFMDGTVEYFQDEEGNDIYFPGTTVKIPKSGVPVNAPGTGSLYYYENEAHADDPTLPEYLPYLNPDSDPQEAWVWDYEAGTGDPIYFFDVETQQRLITDGGGQVRYGALDEETPFRIPGTGEIVVDESLFGASGNALPNGDGMEDLAEVFWGMDPNDPHDTQFPSHQRSGLSYLEVQADTSLIDQDGDGLTDAEELALGSMPDIADSDGDGMPDGWEVRYYLNPNDNGDAYVDADNDDLANIEEYTLSLNPVDFDTDDDGLGDGWELAQIDPNTDEAKADPRTLQENLVAWWRLDQSDSGFVIDHANPVPDGIYDSNPTPASTRAHALSNDAVLKGSASISSSGVINGGLQFSGNDAYALVATDPLLDLQDDFTISFWYNPNEQDAFATRQLLNKQNAYRLIYKDDFTLQWESYYLPVGETEPVAVATAIPLALSENAWNHITVTYVAATGTLTFYVNYDPANAGTTSHSAVTGHTGALAVTEWPLIMGAPRTYPETTPRGTLDDLRLYSAVLSGEEIAQLADMNHPNWEQHQDWESTPDGATALQEFLYGLNAFTNDFDGDGLEDGAELNAPAGLKSDPRLVDSDYDGISDFDEVNGVNSESYVTDPSRYDTDSDGLNDYQEIVTHLTNPLNPDSDSDTMPDHWELTYALDPNDAADRNGDPDEDGRINEQEYALSTNPRVPDSLVSDPMDPDAAQKDLTTDSDGDGLTDWAELNVYGTDPNNADTLGDGLGDKYRADNDLLPYDAQGELIDGPIPAGYQADDLSANGEKHEDNKTVGKSAVDPLNLSAKVFDEQPVTKRQESATPTYRVYDTNTITLTVPPNANVVLVENLGGDPLHVQDRIRVEIDGQNVVTRSATGRLKRNEQTGDCPLTENILNKSPGDVYEFTHIISVPIKEDHRAENSDDITMTIIREYMEVLEEEEEDPDNGGEPGGGSGVGKGHGGWNGQLNGGLRGGYFRGGGGAGGGGGGGAPLPKEPEEGCPEQEEVPPTYSSSAVYALVNYVDLAAKHAASSNFVPEHAENEGDPVEDDGIITTVESLDVNGSPIPPEAKVYLVARKIAQLNGTRTIKWPRDDVKITDQGGTNIAGIVDPENSALQQYTIPGSSGTDFHFLAYLRYSGGGNTSPGASYITVEASVPDSSTQSGNRSLGADSVPLLPVDLDFLHPASGEMTESREQSEGGYIAIRKDGETPITKLKLHKIDEIPSAGFKLVFDSSKIKIWNDENRTQAVISNQTMVPAGIDSELFLEGVKKSESGKDVEITLNVKIGSDESTAVKAKATVVQSEFKTTIQAFIPYLWIDVPGGWTPIAWDEVAIGDNRSYDPTLNQTYRSRQTFIVTPFADLTAEKIKPGSNEGDAGLSIHYDKSVSVPSADQGNLHGYSFVANPVETRRGQGTIRTPAVFKVQEIDSKLFTFKANMTAWEGILGRLAEPITWNLEFGFDARNPVLMRVLVNGTRKGFPAYEIYIMNSDDVNLPIYQWTPPTSRYIVPYLLITEPIAPEQSLELLVP